MARPEDADAVAAMHDRVPGAADTSGTSRSRTGAAPVCTRLAGGHRGVTLVVMSETSSIVGLGNAFPDAGSVSTRRRSALIVEDEYQQRASAGKLQAMLHMATRLGFTEVSGQRARGQQRDAALVQNDGSAMGHHSPRRVAYMQTPLPTVPVKVTVERRRSPRRKVDAGAEDAPAPGKDSRQKSPPEGCAEKGRSEKGRTPQGRGQEGARKAPLPKKTTRQSPSGKSPSGEFSSSDGERSTPDDLVSLTGPGC